MAAVRGVAARWRRQTTVQRARQAAAGLLLLLAFVGRPLWGWLDPRLPVSALYRAGSLDPWGRPFRGATIGTIGPPPMPHSVGPDGIDDYPVDVAWNWKRTQELRSSWYPGDDVQVLSDLRVDLYTHLRELLCGLAVVLVLPSGGLHALRRHWTAPRSPDLAREATRCALLALPLAALTAGLAWLAALLAPAPAAALERGLAGALLVPFPVAVGLACYGLALLIVVGARAGRPRADELGA